MRKLCGRNFYIYLLKQQQMENLKNNLEDISSESKDLAKEYLKYFSLSVSKKLALLAGILFSALVLSLLLLLVLILISFTISGFLNRILASEYAGFFIVTGVYLASILAIVYKISKTKTPLFSNLFVEIFAYIFEIKSDVPVTLEGIDSEKKLVLGKIETDKKLIATNFKLLKYILIEAVIKELFDFFGSKVNKNKGEAVAEEITKNDEKPL